MFTFMLLLALGIVSYGVIRFFVKNKDAREKLVDQVEADAKKLKTSAKKVAVKVEGKIKKKL